MLVGDVQDAVSVAVGVQPLGVTVGCADEGRKGRRGVAELPTSRQVASEGFSPALSQLSWARPVIVRSGLSTSPLPVLACWER
jgi:hypothetical protein